MYKCACCGEVFEDDEVVFEEWDEDRGEFWGIPCTEHMVELRCPFCDSDDIDDYFEDDEEEEKEDEQVYV